MSAAAPSAFAEEAAGVLGCMPNVVANRVSVQLDLRGPGFAVSAEEDSGAVALEVARTLYLARNEAALHSNGDLTKSHYDMNLVAVDAFFRHLRWTGDLDYARRMWPVPSSTPTSP